MDIFFTLLALLLACAIGAAVSWWALRQAKTKSLSVEIHSNVESLRSIGELSVFKVITKEIITETGHAFGEFGRKYLSWAFSKKKLAMIFEFELDFRYDLRREDCTITTAPQISGARRAVIQMPPCEFNLTIRDLHFYDEQKSKALPWLLPSLIGEAFGSGFDEADKNRLIQSAKAHANAEAEKLRLRLREEVEQSAKTTLTALAHSLGVHEVQFQFRPQNEELPQAQVPDFVALAAA